MTDDEFLAAFEAASLTRAEWTHEAHVRMAWLYCRREPTLDAAVARMCSGIPRLNAALGTEPHLYHDTVTQAFGTVVHRRAAGPESPATWSAFRDLHPELFDRSQPILHRHYDPATLSTEAARVGFVPPDREPI